MSSEPKTQDWLKPTAMAWEGVAWVGAFWR